MEQKQFQAESKKLMDMMIHSIYTHKEIFLRELISNASDAIDKLYFKSLTDDSVGMNKSDFKITLAVDKDARTLTITDNGIGMTKEEMEEHLGTIANSGSLQFKKENNLAEDNQIIGQFGVGFYSAFMVAKRVTVKSLAFGETQGYVWQSEGVEGYTMDTCDKDTVGTEITLELLDDVAADEDGNGGENYSEFLDQYRIQSLVKRYSDYIRFPICMDMTKRSTTASIRTSAAIIPIRCAICTSGTRVRSPMMPCCMCRRTHRSTITARTTKRACSCMQTAF